MLAWLDGRAAWLTLSIHPPTYPHPPKTKQNKTGAQGHPAPHPRRAPGGAEARQEGHGGGHGPHGASRWLARFVVDDWANPYLTPPPPRSCPSSQIKPPAGEGRAERAAAGPQDLGQLRLRLHGCVHAPPAPPRTVPSLPPSLPPLSNPLTYTYTLSINQPILSLPLFRRHRGPAALHPHRLLRHLLRARPPLPDQGLRGEALHHRQRLPRQRRGAFVWRWLCCALLCPRMLER